MASDEQPTLHKECMARMVQSMQLRIQRLVQELQQQQQQNPNTPPNPAYKEDADLFGNSAGWMLGGFFVGGFAVAIPLRRTSLLLRLPLTMVGSTVGGQVGMMYGAMRTVKSTLETERRSVISDDILCPALAELKPCLNDRNCMEVMKSDFGGRTMLEWVELCRQREWRHGTTNDQDPAAATDFVGGADGGFGQQEGGDPDPYSSVNRGGAGGQFGGGGGGSSDRGW